MGWTAYYQILRDRPLDDAELVALEEHIARTNRPAFECEGFSLAVTREARADRVLGYGWTKVPQSLDESEDHQRLCDALTALPALLAGVEVRVSDDYECFGWDAASQAVTLDGPGGGELVELDDAARAGFAAPSTLVPPRFRPLAPAVEALVGGGEVTVEALAAGLREHAELPEEHPARPALTGFLAAAPRLALAQAGLAVYDDISRVWPTRDLMLRAVAAVDNLAALVPGFLAVWRAPRGVYWYGDMSFSDATLEALARQPEVEAQMLADVAVGVAGDPSEIVHRRAEHAAHMLGRGRSRAGVLALLGGVRRLRGRTMSTDQRYHTFAGLMSGLVRAAVPAVVPALLLDAGGGDGMTRFRLDGLGVLARLAPLRVAPILRALAEAGEAVFDIIPALAAAGEVESLIALCQFPVEGERQQAATRLRELGHEPPEMPPLPPSELLVTHRSREVRSRALRELAERDDQALLLSFFAAFHLDRAIRRPYDDSWTAFKLLDVIPRPLQRAAASVQLRWLREQGAAGLPEQVIWPAIQPVLDGELDALAASYARPWPRLDAATVAALQAEEAAVIEALERGQPLDEVVAPGGAVELLAARVAPVAAVAVVAEPMAAAPTEVVPPLELDDERAVIDDDSAVIDDDSAVIDDDSAVIDELLTCLAREQVPSAELIERARLGSEIEYVERWDRERALRDALLARGAEEVGKRLVARLTELHDGSAMRDVAEQVLPEVAADPEVAGRLGELFDEAHARPWARPSRVADLLAPVASIPEVFTRCIEEIGAPDDGRLRGRTSSAFELLGMAEQRRELAIAALIGRLRADRGRVAGWRTDALRALRRAGDDSVLPTVFLELAEPMSVGRAGPLLELLARLGGGDRGFEVMAQAIDLPELAVDATKELLRSAWSSEDNRRELLVHPFWKVRIAAAEACPSWDGTRVELFAVWAAIDAAALPGVELERASARGSQASPTATWDELAQAHGVPFELPPLPPLRDGLASTCADHRAWSQWAADERTDPADVVARVLADELDRAMTAYGHARTGPRWSRWSPVVPALPPGRAGRLAWARSQPDDGLPPLLARVRDEGAAAVASEMPRPHLVLDAELRAELEALEAPIAERGLILLRDGADAEM